MKKTLDRSEEINTDADASIKGIALQKLRTVERLLKALLDNRRCIFCTIEHIDDVLEINMEQDGTKYITEQNKSYATPFSMNSGEIKNSIRIFFDNWRKVEESESITFVFYTNTTISKENQVGVLKDIGCKLPKSPLLDLLINKEYDLAFPFVLPIFKNYYIDQHRKHSDQPLYYEQLMESYSDNDWKKFFDRIEWCFGESDERVTRDNIILLVDTLCSKFDVNVKYVDKIVASLLDMVESRALEDDFLEKIVHVSEVKSLFLEFARDAKIQEKLDPIHLKWDQIKCDDIRDLNEKILAVCPEYESYLLDEMEEEYIDGSFEQRQCPDFREVKAYNYRVYKVCLKLVNRVVKEEKDNYSSDDINVILEELTTEAEKIILDKAKTYKIPYHDRDMVRKTILILFQECFLAFDERSVVNG